MTGTKKKLNFGKNGIVPSLDGLGVRSAEMMASVAFLANASSTFGLDQQLLPSRMKGCSYSAFDDGIYV